MSIHDGSRPGDQGSGGSRLDRVFAADLGLGRLHAAVRVTGTWIVSVAAAYLLLAAAGAPPAATLTAILVTSVATMSIGMGVEGRTRTAVLLLMPVTATAGLALGTAVAGRPLATSLAFLGVVVAALAGALRGSAGILVMMAAVVAFYGADLTRPAFQDLGWYIGSAVLGALVSALMLGVVLPPRPAREPARILRSLRVLARDVAAAIPRGRSAAHDRLQRFDAAVGATRGHIQAHPQHWPGPLQPDAGAALATFQLRLEQAAEEALGDPGAMRALHEVVDAPILTITPGAVVQPAAREAGGLGAGNPGEEAAFGAAKGGRPLVSMAAQLLIAAALAVTAGMLIDPAHWFWAVLAALVMLFGTSSAADALGKGLRRVLGTAAGLPVGAVIATVTQHHLALAIGGIVVVMFAQQYTADVAYGWSVFYLTVQLSMLLGLFGSFSVQALWARLLLTAVGALIGVVVALTVLPTRTGALLRGRACDVLDITDVALRGMLTDRPTAEVAQAVRETQTRFLQLVRDAEASKRGWPFSAHHRVLDHQLEAAVIVVRELRATAEDHATGRGLTPQDRAAATSVRRRLDDVRRQLGAPDAPPSATVTAPHQEKQVTVPAEGASPATALRRLDGAVGNLHRALAAG